MGSKLGSKLRRLHAGSVALSKKDVVGASKALFPPHFEYQITADVLAQRNDFLYHAFFSGMLHSTRFFRGVNYSGLEHIANPDVGTLILSNHPDMKVIGHIAGAGLKAGKPMSFTSAGSLWSGLSRFRTHFVYRYKDACALPQEQRPSTDELRQLNNAAYQVTRDLLAIGDNVVLFPEGGRTKGEYDPKCSVLKNLFEMLQLEPSPTYCVDTPVQIVGMHVSYHNRRPKVHVTASEPYRVQGAPLDEEVANLKKYLLNVVPVKRT